MILPSSVYACCDTPILCNLNHRTRNHNKTDFEHSMQNTVNTSCIYSLATVISTVNLTSNHQQQVQSKLGLCSSYKNWNNTHIMEFHIIANKYFTKTQGVLLCILETCKQRFQYNQTSGVDKFQNRMCSHRLVYLLGIFKQKFLYK